MNLEKLKEEIRKEEGTKFDVYKDHNHEYTKAEIDEIKLLLLALNERKKIILKQLFQLIQLDRQKN